MLLSVFSDALFTMSKNPSAHSPSLLTAGLLLIALLGFASQANANTIWFSNLANWSTFQDGDVVSYDTETGLPGTTELFDEASFTSAGEDVYGFSRVSNGGFALSTQGTATLGGLTFQNEDIVLYDPLADTASLLFDGTSVLGAGAAIDAVHICIEASVSCTAGDILFSTTQNVTLGGVTYDDDDVIAWNPASATGSLFFDTDLYTDNDAELNGFHVTRDGRIYFTLAELETISGTTFDDTAIVEFDIATGEVVSVFETAAFGTNDVDALSLIPEPSTAVLISMGLVMLNLRRHSQAA